MQPSLPEFDVLVDMARNDPERLEALRQSMVQNVIDNSGDEGLRRRLAGVQFRVDAVRRRSASPLAACIQISEMMCQSLAELHRSMVAPETHPNAVGTASAALTEAEAPAPTAKVITLSSRRRPLDDGNL